jgi:hypothetical protein
MKNQTKHRKSLYGWNKVVIPYMPKFFVSLDVNDIQPKYEFLKEHLDLTYPNSTKLVLIGYIHDFMKCPYSKLN